VGPDRGLGIKADLFSYILSQRFKMGCGMYVWSTPRSGSTCFYRAFLEICGIFGLLEPFILKENEGGEQVDPISKKGKFLKIQDGIFHYLTSNEYLIVKEHAWVLHKFLQPTEIQALFSSTFQSLKHILLIRSPLQILSSWKRLIDLGTDDSGRKYIEYARRDEMDFRSLEFVYAALQGNCLIIDMDQLIDNPSEILKEVCAYVRFPYSSKLLNWQPITQEMMKTQEKFTSFLMGQCDWFKSIIHSTTFRRSQVLTKDEILEAHPSWKEMLETNMGSYTRLLVKMKHQTGEISLMELPSFGRG